MDIEKAINVAESLEKPFEQCRLFPYLCPAGVPTIGYGATYYENGERVTLLDSPITHERAIELLEWMNRTVYMPAVIKLCPRIDTPERLGAITDLSFNIGVKALKNSSLRRSINAKKWNLVPIQIMKWIHGGGKVLPGLVKRRKAEIALI